MDPTLSIQWAMIVGFFMPIVIALILQRQWTKKLKAVVSFALILVASYFTAYFEGAVDRAHLLNTFFYVLTLTISSFKALWQPTGIAQSIETATSLPAEETSA